MNPAAAIDLEAEIADMILDIVASPSPITFDLQLDELSGFDSHALYQLIDRLEERLAAEFPARLVVPATFATVATLAAALRQSGVVSGRKRPNA